MLPNQQLKLSYWRNKFNPMIFMDLKPKVLCGNDMPSEFQITQAPMYILIVFARVNIIYCWFRGCYSIKIILIF